jgi:hypothetical protein
MPIPIFNFKKNNFSNSTKLFLGIFHPADEPISPHRLRCGPFAVFKYNFLGHCLASFNTREGRRVLARE